MPSGVRLIFWDLGGQKELRTLWDKYFSECHGVIYVIDSADKNRITETRESFESVMRSETVAGVPLLLVANKQDIEESLPLSKVKQEIFGDTDESSSDLIFGREFHAIGTSALTGEGIDDSINWMVNAIKNNSRNRPPRQPED